MKCLLASLKTLILKVVPKATSNFCSFALLGQFLLFYIHGRLLEQVSESLAGFGTFLKGSGGNQKAGTSSLKRVTGRNFTISK
jgi:hypothetical protein